MDGTRLNRLMVRQVSGAPVPGREVAAAAPAPEFHLNAKENQDRGMTSKGITTEAAGSRIPKGRGTKHYQLLRGNNGGGKRAGISKDQAGVACRLLQTPHG